MPEPSDTSAAQPAQAQPITPRSLVRPVLLLGITQIIAWGSLFYSIAVLAPAMSESLNVSTTLIFGAFSLSLAVSGLVSPAVGRAIDSHGGYKVLASGSLLSALSLATIAVADSPALFLAGWALAGIAMAANLYDASFPALSQFSGQHYRPALTALTLLGGFASTVFWPLAWVIGEAYGWRAALGLFALMHLMLCLPMHFFGLPRPQPKIPAGSARIEARAKVANDARFVWLATAFTLSAFVVSGTAAHGVGALKASGLDPATAILAVSLIGPMQVVGRMLEFALARGIAATRVGLASLTVMLIAMLLLTQAGLSAWLAFGFAGAYGLSNGVMSIVRGTVPAELFGREEYGALMGRLAQPAFFAKALAPVLLAAMIADGGHYHSMGWLMTALAALALIAYLTALAHHRARTQSP